MHCIVVLCSSFRQGRELVQIEMGIYRGRSEKHLHEFSNGVWSRYVSVNNDKLDSTGEDEQKRDSDLSKVGFPRRCNHRSILD